MRTSGLAKALSRGRCAVMAGPSLTPVENASQLRPLCQQACGSQWTIRRAPTPRQAGHDPGQSSLRVRPRPESLAVAPGQLRIMCLSSPSICHLALQARDEIHFLLRKPMVCCGPPSPCLPFSVLIRKYPLKVQSLTGRGPTGHLPEYPQPPPLPADLSQGPPP